MATGAVTASRPLHKKARTASAETPAMRIKAKNTVLLMTTALLPLASFGSSHREAPNITRLPTVDSTDFYMFNSYEPGRDGYVTLIANYIPLQQPYGGPNYFAMDSAALYEILIDNNGDA